MISRIPHLPWRRWSNSRNAIRSPAISLSSERSERGVAVEEAGNQVATRGRRGLPGSICEVRPVPPSAATTPTAFPTLVADYADGLTQVQIAKKHGLHVQAVRERLIAAGIDTRARLRALTDEELRVVRAAMSEGASAREVARGVGVAHTTVIRSMARREEVSESPSRTTPARRRTSPIPVQARRSPLRTTSEVPSDQGKRESKPIPASRCWDRTLGTCVARFQTFPRRQEP